LPSPDPIFAESRDSLVSQLRLSGASSDDATAAIDAAMSAVAIGLYDRMGSGLVDTIRSYTYSNDPTSGAQSRQRLKGAVIEEKWVRYELMRKMPVLFVGSRGASLDRWNQEELTRDGEVRDSELQRLWSEVLDGIDDLRGNTNAGAVSAVTFGPDTTPVCRPGDSIKPQGTQFNA